MKRGYRVVSLCIVGCVAAIAVLYVAQLAGRQVVFDALGAPGGMGLADYSLIISQHYSFVQMSTTKHGIVGPVVPLRESPNATTNAWIIGHITKLGWNGEYMICYVASVNSSKAQFVSATNNGPGWWIIELDSHKMWGPLVEAAAREFVVQRGVKFDEVVRSPSDFPVRRR